MSQPSRYARPLGAIPLALALCATGAGAPATAVAAPAACASNDAACFRAQAAAAEAEADRLIAAMGAAPAAPPAKAAPARAAAPAQAAPPAAAKPAAPAAAGAGRLVDGEYDCGGGYTYRAMGKVDIQGGKYRYRPYDEVVSGFQAYSVAGGKIQWSGKFGGLDDAPAKITSSTVEKFGFNVNYQGSPDALINTMSCHAPGK